MIQINLAQKKNSAGAATGGNMDPGSTPQLDAGDMAQIRKAALLRFLVILLGPAALFVYEGQIIPDLKHQLQVKNNQLTEVTQKNQKAVEAVNTIKRIKKEQEILQTQIKSIENLKEDRLREVHILDFIQKDLPDHLWLAQMELNDGRLSIQGLSTTDSELTQFMDTLSKSVYLKEVSLVRSTDFNSLELGNLKKFEISCLMEATP